MHKKKKWYGRMGLCLLLVLFCTGCTAEKKEAQKTAKPSDPYTQELFAMDTYMTFTAYGEKGQQAVKAAIKEVERLDALWSVSSETGEIYQINQTKEGTLSEDTAALYQRAAELHKSTKGAFDITVYPLMELWGFTTGNYNVPDQTQLNKVKKQVDQDRLSFDADTQTLRLGANQEIDLGGIAKGYTSARIMELWKKQGITSGMVSLGGNVQVLGTKPDGSKWNIGIQDPKPSSQEVVGAVTASDKAVITSGGYERYFEENGKTYHHILDTRTGCPAESDLSSVSIVSKDGTLADGLSTSLFIMGKNKAIAYWRKHSESFDAIWITKEGEILATEGLEDSFSAQQKINWVKKK